MPDPVDDDDSSRRAFVRRAAIGVPLVLATVHGRTVLGAMQTPGSACGSCAPSSTPVQPTPLFPQQ